MLHYHLYDLAPDFDFLASDSPPALKYLFEDQLKRARDLLAHRTPAQVAYALESLDWMLEEGGERLEEYALEVCNTEGECYVNRTKALKHLQAVFDIAEQESLPNASWVDYFAVLAIAYVAEMVNELETANRPSNWESNYGLKDPELKSNTSDSIRYVQIEWALESMEAVCYAEHLNWIADANNRTEVDLEALRQEAHKDLSSKGGKKRVARYKPLKENILAHHDAHYANRSARNAAKRIYEDLASEINAVLNTEDPEKQIEKWLGQHRRKKRKQSDQKAE